MALSLSFHIIGLVFWLGGLAILTRFMQLFSEQLVPDQSQVPDAARILVRRVWLGFVISGLILSTLTGLYQVLHMGVGYYLKQGWFHGKLTLVILLYVVTVMIGLEVAKIGKGESLVKKKLSMLHGMSALILVLTVLITFVGRLGL